MYYNLNTMEWIYEIIKVLAQSDNVTPEQSRNVTLGIQ